MLEHTNKLKLPSFQLLAIQNAPNVTNIQGEHKVFP